MPTFEPAAVPVPAWKGWRGAGPVQRDPAEDRPRCPPKSPNRADWHATWERKQITGSKVLPGKQQQPERAERET